MTKSIRYLEGHRDGVARAHKEIERRLDGDLPAHPQRLRRRRVKGYDMQRESRALNGLEAVSCTRPGRYGNPYVPGGLAALDLPGALSLFRSHLMAMLLSDGQFLLPLRDKNLACWCALDADHCHVDVLLDAVGRAYRA